MALSLEKLLDQGFTRDDIMKLADSGAFGDSKKDPEPDQDKEVNDKKDVEEVGSATDPTTAILSMMTKMMENQNNMMLKMMENKSESAPEDKPGETPEESARKFSDEKLTKALQSLNILKDGDTIDIGSAVEKNIENKILGKLGAAVGFTVDEKKQ